MIAVVVLVGVFLFIASINFLCMDGNKAIWIPFLCFSLLLPLIGFYENDKIVSSKHTVIHQDTWNGITFDKVKTIEYDAYEYPFWTYNTLEPHNAENVKIHD